MHFLHKCCHRRRHPIATPSHCCCRRRGQRTAAVLGWWMTNGGWAGIVPNHVNCQAFLPPHYTNRGPTPLMTKNDTLLEQRHIVDEWIKKKLGAILLEINFWNWISVLLESLKVKDRFWNQAKNWLKSSHSMTQQFEVSFSNNSFLNVNRILIRMSNFSFEYKFTNCYSTLDYRSSKLRL